MGADDPCGALETEKRGCKLSISTFQHFLRPAILGIALILNVHTYVSDIETRESTMPAHLTPPLYPKNWDYSEDNKN